MLKISRESEINLVNVLIDNDIISGKDLINIKKVSTESNKSQIDAIFELKLTDEQKIIDLLAPTLAGPFLLNEPVLLGLGLHQRLLDNCCCAVRKTCELGAVLTR